MAKTEALLARRWRNAFARQSRSDRKVYDLLAKSGQPECHRLQFLQMHLEKLAKAFCCDQSPTQVEVSRIQQTHNVIAKTPPLLVRQYWSQASKAKKPRNAELKRLREICRELDLLAPAIENGGLRKDNCEYPWPSMVTGTSVVTAPCKHHFPVTERLASHDGVTLLKVAECACQDLLQGSQS